MIPTIGVMVAAYIVARMLDLILAIDTRPVLVKIIVKTFAAIAIVVAVASTIDLISSATRTTLPSLP